VVFGGLLAGLGLSIAVALLMHVVQEASPIGYEMNLDGIMAALVLIAGPLFGFGLAAAMVALIPADNNGSSASASQAMSADHRPNGQ
jgi:hypothetical protein